MKGGREGGGEEEGREGRRDGGEGEEEEKRKEGEIGMMSMIMLIPKYLSLSLSLSLSNILFWYKTVPAIPMGRSRWLL